MADEKQVKMACCAATCLIVTLLITGWALNSFSNSCSNFSSCDTDDQKTHLQTASSGVIAAAAGIALMCFMFVTYTNKDDIMKVFRNSFGTSGGSDSGFGHSFGNSFGHSDSIFAD